MVIEITKDNVEGFVSGNGRAIIDFHASWCGPCKAMSPIVDSFADEHPEIAVGKCDVGENADVAEKFGVVTIPFIAFFKDGEIFDTMVGLQKKEKLEKIITE